MPKCNQAESHFRRSCTTCSHALLGRPRAMCQRNQVAPAPRLSPDNQRFRRLRRCRNFPSIEVANQDDFTISEYCCICEYPVPVWRLGILQREIKSKTQSSHQHRLRSNAMVQLQPQWEGSTIVNGRREAIAVPRVKGAWVWLRKCAKPALANNSLSSSPSGPDLYSVNTSRSAFSPSNQDTSRFKRGSPSQPGAVGSPPQLRFCVAILMISPLLIFNPVMYWNFQHIPPHQPMN